MLCLIDPSATSRRNSWGETATARGRTAAVATATLNCSVFIARFLNRCSPARIQGIQTRPIGQEARFLQRGDTFGSVPGLGHSNHPELVFPLTVELEDRCDHQLVRRIQFA